MSNFSVMIFMENSGIVTVAGETGTSHEEIAYLNREIIGIIGMLLSSGGRVGFH